MDLENKVAELKSQVEEVCVLSDLYCLRIYLLYSKEV